MTGRATVASVAAQAGRYVQCEGPNDDCPPGPFVPEAERRGYLEAALAGVELGAYDNRILDWLAQWDDDTCRLVCSLLVRSRRAGLAEAAPLTAQPGCADAPAGPALVLSAGWEAVLGQALADAVSYRDQGGFCAGCEAIPPAAVPGDPGRLAPGLCDDHAGDLDRADAYLALARDLGIEVDR